MSGWMVDGRASSQRAGVGHAGYCGCAPLYVTAHAWEGLHPFQSAPLIVSLTRRGPATTRNNTQNTAECMRTLPAAIPCCRAALGDQCVTTGFGYVAISSAVSQIFGCEQRESGHRPHGMAERGGVACCCCCWLLSSQTSRPPPPLPPARPSCRPLCQVLADQEGPSQELPRGAGRPV